MRTLALIALLAACGADAPREPAPGDVPDSAGPPAPEPVFPAEPGALAPSFARIPDAVTGAALADTETCDRCHPDVVAQWRTSAHHFASLSNPIYRVSVESFRAARGHRATNFCAGCHDVALLADGVDVSQASLDDPRAAAGVTCRVCHGIEAVTADGNGSYTLAVAPIALPRNGDPASVEEHKRTAAPAPLRTAALCGACHRAFLGDATGNGHHLPGMDDFTAWQRSPYAGSHLDRIDGDVPERQCRDCHMPGEPSDDPAADDGTIASHRFTGGHSWLAAMRGDDAQLARVRERLRSAATIDVAAVTAGGARHVPADGAPVEGGTAVLIDVVVRNVGVGHRFPGGTLDAHDTWIELDVRDADGRLVGSAAAGHAGDPDPDAHTLRALVVDDAGEPALERDVHRFRAVVWNHTVAPRDARAARYQLPLPPDPAFPLAVEARLRHRSRGLPLQRATCEAGRRGGELDPCAPQPITDIATARVAVGAGAAAAETSPRTWRRVYEHGLALLHSVQEHLDDARYSLDQALDDAGGTTAMVTLQLGRLAGAQGRLDEATRWLDRTARRAPDHPAIAMARAEAHAQVWRWDAAAEHAAAAAAGAPRDDRAWKLLAVASASAGDPRAALAAAVRGLALRPRDPDLLRTQALALDKLGHPEADRALEVFLAHRRRDDAPVLRALCSKKSPRCANDRTPLHVHPVVPAWSP